MRLVIAALLALCLSACGDDRFPDYRYKMTVEVATPDGVKSFSSVRQVRQEQKSSVLNSGGRTVDTRVAGEAVVLDLPGGPVFALLSRPDDADYAKYIAGAALKADMPPKVRDGPGDDLDALAREQQFMVDVAGPKELPRTRPSRDKVRDPEPLELWPFFVRFGDLGDPTSVREVSPESIGVRRITIEITNDSVSDQLRAYLPWLETFRGRKLDGQRFNNSTTLSNTLSAGSFATENVK